MSSSLSIQEIAEVMQLAEQYAHLAPDRILLSKRISNAKLRPFVARQVALAPRFMLRFGGLVKRPFFFAYDRSIEQASSLSTASFKTGFLTSEDCLWDGSGGLGIDFLLMAGSATKAHYMDLDAATVAAAQYNLSPLLHKDCDIIQGDLLSNLPMVVSMGTTLLYFDPSRRSSQGQRFYSMEDTEPNPIAVVTQLQKLCYTGRILIKLSPMLDISEALRHFCCERELYIVSVLGEVKELLVRLDLARDGKPLPHTPIHVVDLTMGGTPSSAFSYSIAEERTLSLPYAETDALWLIIPHNGVSKSGAYRSLCKTFGLQAISPKGAILAAKTLPATIPGKVYRVRNASPLTASRIKHLSHEFPIADITVRELPYNAAALHKRSGVKPGDRTRLVACPDSLGRATLFEILPLTKETL